MVSVTDLIVTGLLKVKQIFVRKLSLASIPSNINISGMGLSKKSSNTTLSTACPDCGGYSGNSVRGIYLLEGKPAQTQELYMSGYVRSSGLLGTYSSPYIGEMYVPRNNESTSYYWACVFTDDSAFNAGPKNEGWCPSVYLGENNAEGYTVGNCGTVDDTTDSYTVSSNYKVLKQSPTNSFDMYISRVLYKHNSYSNEVTFPSHYRVNGYLMSSSATSNLALCLKSNDNDTVYTYNSKGYRRHYSGLYDTILIDDNLKNVMTTGGYADTKTPTVEKIVAYNIYYKDMMFINIVNNYFTTVSLTNCVIFVATSMIGSKGLTVASNVSIPRNGVAVLVLGDNDMLYPVY